MLDEKVCSVSIDCFTASNFSSILLLVYLSGYFVRIVRYIDSIAMDMQRKNEAVERLFVRIKTAASMLAEKKNYSKITLKIDLSMSTTLVLSTGYMYVNYFEFLRFFCTKEFSVLTNESNKIKTRCCVFQIDFYWKNR